MNIFFSLLFLFLFLLLVSLRKQEPGVFGWIDVLDILSHVLDVTNSSVDFSTETIQNLKWEGQCFARKEVASLVSTYIYMYIFSTPSSISPPSRLITLSSNVDPSFYLFFHSFIRHLPKQPLYYRYRRYLSPRRGKDIWIRSTSSSGRR